MVDTADAKNIIKSIAQDPTISPDLKRKIDELQDVLSNSSVLQSDRFIYRFVVIILGVTVLATIFGGLFLAYKGDSNYKLPAEIVAIGSAAIGALAGLLAPSPSALSK